MVVDRGVVYNMNIIFTSHVKERMELRKILKEEVIDAILHPDIIIKEYGEYYFQKKLERGTIELPCERTETYIKVITVYWL